MNRLRLLNSSYNVSLIYPGGTVAMRTRRYTIVLEPDEADGGYAVVVPALPGCITQGDSVAECIERATEAITGYIASLEAADQPVPEETERPQAITIEIGA